MKGGGEGGCTELPGTTWPVWLSTCGLRLRLREVGGVDAASSCPQHVGMFGSDAGSLLAQRLSTLP